jgi:O-6-methylguanine DNA methyltransferase
MRIATTTTSWVQPSPLGPLSITTTPAGVRSVWFAGTGQESGPPDTVVAQAFGEYFSGDLQALDSLPVDLDGRTDFGRAVLVALRALGPSRLTSYGELAAAIGRPAAARAVGRAVGANPVPVVIPCHRVLAAGGSLGGYSGGLDTKRWLLAHEGWLPQPTVVASGTPAPTRPR